MDARVVRTRAAIQQALFDLIREKRWEKITVQDLLDRTGVSRSTFYAHYDHKLDVLTGEIPQLDDMIATDPDTSNVRLVALFEHAEEMAGVFAPLLSQPVLGAISAAIETRFAERFADIGGPDTPATLPRFLAGAVLTTIREFVTDRNRPAPATIATEVEQYINRVLEAHAVTPLHR